MTQNQLMSVAALGFAAFALYQFTSRPSATRSVVAAQPGQAQRDMGLQQLVAQINRQYEEMARGIDYSLATLAPRAGLNF